MSYGLDLLRDGGDFEWFEEIVETERKAPADWEATCETIRAELKRLIPELEETDQQLYDVTAGVLIEFYYDGSASISVAGRGDWHTRAPQVRAYLDVFERFGFAAYDQQAGEKWESGKSEQDITTLLKELEIPEITSTGQGCSLKPLTDDQWDRMM